MKILKIFGFVVGIHLFALILIFANPGCSSTSKPAPAAGDTVAKTEPAPAAPAPAPVTDNSPPVVSVPSSFNPDAPAVAGPGSSGGLRYTPTRPGTPVASTLVAEPVPDVTPTTTYTVKSGDNLWILAKKNNLTVAQLASVNNIKVTAVLHDGQKLLIPGKATSPAVSAHASAATTAKPAAATATTAAPKTAGEPMKHTVKSGESLGTIAKTYGVRAHDIAVANNISDPMKLPIGKVLIIPGWKPTGGTAKSSGTASATASPAGAKPEKAPAEPVKPLFSNPAAPGADSPIQSVPAPAGSSPIMSVPTPGSDAPVLPVTDTPKKP